jgi:UDPglucose 6-dehydrogenase
MCRELLRSMPWAAGRRSNVWSPSWTVIRRVFTVFSDIAVIGTGYVGLVTGACFAELGNDVVCLDVDVSRIESLRSGNVPFFEPGLEELVRRNASAGRLSFEFEPDRAIPNAAIVFLAVGTPQTADGSADLSYLRRAAVTIAENLGRDTVIVNKSTVPVETGDLVAAIVRERKSGTYHVSVVSNPEFLREGSAISDFMHPDRIVLGVDDTEAAAMMRHLYAPLDAKIIEADVRTAEMIKCTANAFLATKISFANQIALICERVGTDVTEVMRGAGADHRIGTAFLGAGIGFGGSCFPKDLTALSRVAERVGVVPSLLEATLTINREQIERAVDRIEKHVGTLQGARVAVLGLAFKSQTDDVRESPAIALVERLLEKGATVVAHDPVAISTARRRLGRRVMFAQNAYEASSGADVLVIATDWNEYKQLDLRIVKGHMRGRLVFDGRNVFDPQDVVVLGFDYIGIGRHTRVACADGSAVES